MFWHFNLWFQRALASKPKVAISVVSCIPIISQEKQFVLLIKIKYENLKVILRVNDWDPPPGLHSKLFFNLPESLLAVSGSSEIPPFLIFLFCFTFPRCCFTKPIVLPAPYPPARAPSLEAGSQSQGLEREDRPSPRGLGSHCRRSSHPFHLHPGCSASCQGHLWRWQILISHSGHILWSALTLTTLKISATLITLQTIWNIFFSKMFFLFLFLSIFNVSDKNSVQVWNPINIHWRRRQNY